MASVVTRSCHHVCDSTDEFLVGTDPGKCLCKVWQAHAGEHVLLACVGFAALRLLRKQALGDGCKLDARVRRVYCWWCRTAKDVYLACCQCSHSVHLCQRCLRIDWCHKFPDLYDGTVRPQVCKSSSECGALRERVHDPTLDRCLVGVCWYIGVFTDGNNRRLCFSELNEGGAGRQEDPVISVDRRSWRHATSGRLRGATQFELTTHLN
mmetsp:Transcript_19888/g.50503  ORF Transcript_19888/g.50503 Transcript_19888/m.50503 type:complete len:209 (-) Transcript_19888:296-922(-)